MTDFEFFWFCTARLKQTTDLLIQALNIDEGPDRSGGEVVQALGKAAWFARVTRGFIGSRLCDILLRARIPDPETWLREFASELEQIERAPEIRPLLADLMKRHQSLVSASTSVLTGDKTASEKLPDYEFVLSMLLTLKALRKALDELERIDRAPRATGHESIRATFEFQFWAERAKQFPSDRLVGVASTYGLPNAQFWRFEFSNFLNSLSKGKYDANMSIEKIIDIQDRWEPVRDVLRNEAFVPNLSESTTLRVIEPKKLHTTFDEVRPTENETALPATDMPPCPSDPATLPPSVTLDGVKSSDGPIRPSSFQWRGKRLTERLTKTEYKLLAYIFERRANPPTVNELKKQFWPKSYDERGSYDKFATQLRGKLNPIGATIDTDNGHVVISPLSSSDPE